MKCIDKYFWITFQCVNYRHGIQLQHTLMHKGVDHSCLTINAMEVVKHPSCLVLVLGQKDKRERYPYIFHLKHMVPVTTLIKSTTDVGVELG
jgi:hypothetical protein